jgi:hypothetical protein
VIGDSQERQPQRRLAPIPDHGSPITAPPITHHPSPITVSPWTPNPTTISW